MALALAECSQCSGTVSPVSPVRIVPPVSAVLLAPDFPLDLVLNWLCGAVVKYSPRCAVATLAVQRSSTGSEPILAHLQYAVQPLEH